MIRTKTPRVVDQGRSPRTYDCGVDCQTDVRRLGLVDPNASRPLGHHTYFAPTYRSWSRTGKLLKKPVLDCPNAAPGTIAFLDYHEIGNNGWFIDLLIVRPDFRGHGYARLLIDQFYSEHADASIIMWGPILHRSAWDIYQEYCDLAERGLAPRSTGFAHF